ncbi:hypothetical protein ABFX02_14G271900 [Erythranthe guttata]
MQFLQTCLNYKSFAALNSPNTSATIVPSLPQQLLPWKSLKKDEIEITCSVDSNTCSETTVEDGIKLPCSGITDESVSSSPAADEKHGSYIFLIPKEYGVTQPTYEGYLPAAAADENYRPYIFFVIPEEYGVMPPTYKAYPPGWICVDTGYRAIPPDWDAVPPIEGTPLLMWMCRLLALRFLLVWFFQGPKLLCKMNLFHRVGTVFQYIGRSFNQVGKAFLRIRRSCLPHGAVFLAIGRSNHPWRPLRSRSLLKTKLSIWNLWRMTVSVDADKKTGLYIRIIIPKEYGMMRPGYKA